MEEFPTPRDFEMFLDAEAQASAEWDEMRAEEDGARGCVACGRPVPAGVVICGPCGFDGMADTRRMF